MYKRMMIVAATLTLYTPCPAPAQNLASAPNAARLAWWREARFGMFIHWGPVSLKGTEIGWSRGDSVPIVEYDALYRSFNPTKFDADQWVKIAKAAGMKYMVFTTKHHDGFCMFDTKQTDYNVMNSPFGRDVVKELAEACKRHGLAFGTYYSVCDWHHPDFPLGSPGGKVKKPEPNLDRYERYLVHQVTELIRNYGPLLIMWFDVPQEFTPERGQRIVDVVRGLQPDIIVNNRAGVPADYDTPEQTIGGYQYDRPWETCMTVCNQWAWKPDDAMKTLPQCLQTLIRCAGGDGNLLFNVGPMPTGEIEPRQVERLTEMGRWLARYGETIYGTRGGPYRPGTWGCSTRKGSMIYLHILNWADDVIKLPPIPARILKVSVLTGGTPTWDQNAEGVTISVPKSARDPIDTIIQLSLDGPVEQLRAVSVDGPLSVDCKATASNVYQNLEIYAASCAVDDNEGTRWATDGGTHAAWIELDLGKPRTFRRLRVVQEPVYAERVRRYELLIKDGDDWRPILTGTTMPAELVRDFPAVTARFVRLNIPEAAEGPTVNEIQLYGPKTRP